MDIPQEDTRHYSALYHLLTAMAFCLPLSIALAEPLAFLCILLWIVVAARTKRLRSALHSPLFGPVAAFVLIAVVVSLFGVRPAQSIRKFHRLALPLMIFVIAEVADAKREGTGVLPRLVIAFITGTVLLGVYDLVRVPIQVWQGRSWFDTGNMRDPQFYLVALGFLCAYVLFGDRRRRAPWMALFIALAGLILHFKRGVWFSFLLGISGLAVVVRKWKLVALVVLCAGLILLIPQVRERIGQINDEFRLGQGGRVAIWTRVVPALLSQHPLGMGFCAIRHEDLAAYAPYIQPKLSHLHNNLFQVVVETGWPGLAAWLAWMSTTWMLLLLLSREPDDPPSPRKWIACGAFSAFTGLMVNGLVESNFSDTEILMLLCLLMGITSALWTSRTTPDSAS
ncbi:MAG: hypothetical protein EOM20_10170 [Spartobacteria bacterium]|nr:hypothetical protein [Spartobacteria bacterium]